jgi:folate-binding protein YgfZ
MSDSLTATPIERDVVIVSGVDASDYLQTQLTQDVGGLAAGHSAWSFLLNPKSVIEAMFRITKSQDGGVMLDVEPGYGAPIRKQLDQFLSRLDVSFAEELWPGIAWRGPGASGGAIDAPIVAPYPWDTSEAVDVVGPDVSLPDGVNRLTDDDLNVLRIEARWPKVGTEIDGVATPAMTGLVEQTVSFTKGCYTGQEFVARVHHRDAKPPRQLVQVNFEYDTSVGVASDITIDGESVGIVTSAVPSAGLALGYCKRSVVLPAEARVGSAVVSVS